MKNEKLLQTLYTIATGLTSSLAPEEVLATIVEGITKTMNFKGCSLMLISPDKSRLIHTTSYGISKGYLRKGPVQADAIIKRVMQGRTVLIKDAIHDSRVQYKEQAEKEGIASMLSVPLMPDDEVVGILRVYTSEQRQFTAKEIKFLSSLANLGALALRKAMLNAALGRSLEEHSAKISKMEEDQVRFLRFLNMAAHDLKAPLAAIQGFLWIMLDGYCGVLGDKQRDMLQRSSLRIDELLYLISDLLDIPRIESGQMLREMEGVPLCQIIEGSCSELYNQAKDKGIELRMELPQCLPEILGSNLRLKQVITNLVGNAINYTSQGAVTVRAAELDDDVEVEVIDTGIGIPPQDLPLIFDDFFRASNIGIRGTGLGLSITKRILEAHGGKIRVESPPSGSQTGSKFTFILPKKSGGLKEGDKL
ncbi:ATP-binding protein [Chloroflexota bacterium]